MNKQPQIVKSILLSLLGIIIYYLSYLLIYLIIGGAIEILSKIPLIGWLIGFLFYIRGDSPDMMLSLICPAASCLLSGICIEKLSKDRTGTFLLASLLLGIFLIIINAIAVILNLCYGEAMGILKNICIILSGLYLAGLGKDVFDKSSTD